MKRMIVFTLLGAGMAWLASPPAYGQAKSAQEELDRKVLEALGDINESLRGDPAPPGNPLTQVSGHMKVVVDDLSKLSTGRPTQEKQKEIVGELDRLIAQLEKECEACRNGGGRSGNNPRKPLNDSRIVGGPGGIGDLHAPRPDGKAWGELPARERARILQATDDGFPAHYQRILERYYRRVAEEQQTTPPATSGTKP